MLENYPWAGTVKVPVRPVPSVKTEEEFLFGCRLALIEYAKTLGMTSLQFEQVCSQVLYIRSRHRQNEAALAQRQREAAICRQHEADQAQP